MAAREKPVVATRFLGRALSWEYAYTPLEKSVRSPVQATEKLPKFAQIEEKKDPVDAVIETISGIFSPTLPVLIGCGMFKAIVSLITNLGLATGQEGFMVVLSMIGDLIFYFFPFFLAVSAAKKFKVSEYMALALAAAYMYPTIADGAAAAAETGITSLSFFGLPILFVSYKSTVIPIILSVWVLSLIYKHIDSLVPDMLKILLTMMGMHYALAPLQIQQIAETGISTLLVSALTANFSQAGAAFGAFLAVKDKSMKSVAASASLSAFLGITEPAMFGVNLKYKRPFAFAMASSAVAAAFLSLFDAKALAYAPPGFFTIITYTASNFAFVIIGVAIAFILAAALTFFFGIPKEQNVAGADKAEQGADAPAATSATAEAIA